MPGMGMPGMGMPGMGMPGMDMGDGSDEEEGDSDDEGAPPVATENGTNAQNNQESNKTSDEPVSKTPAAGEQGSTS